MTVAHASLTGADLHEPKGIDAASASSVYVSDGLGSGDWTSLALLTPQLSSFGTVSCRLSLVNGTAISESDQDNMGTVYMVPVENDNIAIYDGTAWQVRTYTQQSLILDSTTHTTNSNFSAFSYWNGSEVKVGSGPAWISNTSPGSGSGTSEIELFEGRLVNKNAIILRNNGANSSSIAARQALLVGGFRCSGTATTSDSAKKRFLSNVYNKYPRTLKMVPTTTQWNLTGADVITMRQANLDSFHQIETFFVTGGNPVDMNLTAMSLCGTASISIRFGIGWDQTGSGTPSDASINKMVQNYYVASLPHVNHYKLTHIPGQGYNRYVWLEAAGSATVRTVYGDAQPIGSILVSSMQGMTYN
jgi:hypothetical protein